MAVGGAIIIEHPVLLEASCNKECRAINSNLSAIVNAVSVYSVRWAADLSLVYLQIYE